MLALLPIRYFAVHTVQMFLCILVYEKGWLEKAQTKTQYTVIVSAPSGKCGCFLLSSSLFAICCKIMMTFIFHQRWRFVETYFVVSDFGVTMRYHYVQSDSQETIVGIQGHIMGLWIRRNPFHRKGERGGVYIGSITWWGHTTCTYYWVLRGRTDAPFLSHLNVLVNCQAAVKTQKMY